LIAERGACAPDVPAALTTVATIGDVLAGRGWLLGLASIRCRDHRFIYICFVRPERERQRLVRAA
jgi:hypothetical protein